MNLQPIKDEDYIKVNSVDAFFMPLHGIPTIVCYLEDGRQFYLFSVPAEIVIAINKTKGNKEEEFSDKRENIYDIISFIPEIMEEFSKHIEKVVIDDMIRDTGVYVATVEFKFDGVIIQKRMIPSHAIFLAIISNKPIFVKKGLVDEQEKESREGQQKF
ncbi:bifunctional nuclease family protein [Sulfolobus sp. E5-1-F]|uniref:bifunctional nuclease family protein n=1 Tax=Sulfolobaceae TaxID=118883 RepID=UPI0012961E90|nr:MULTISPECIES: bifunctional nuclease family protein [unclassified Sulfolobus]QGA54977.1 bifunctional nuclease family protein [Sulfolobus sp. E5-1-F]QGA67804.1 bifunctional nuclease family protein [Sulfolobus sp. E11-6]